MLRPYALRCVAAVCALFLSAASQVACADPGEENNQVVFPTSAPAIPPAAPAPGLTTGCNDEGTIVGRLLGRVYAVPVENRALPDFSTLPSVGTVCLDRLLITERRGEPGFPGIANRTEWFAVDLRGAFTVQDPGSYSFGLSADDGARLYIDGALVVQNDGFHITRSLKGTVNLTAGPHSIAVPYWQGPGPLALVLEVAPAGGSFQVFRVDEPLRGAVLAP
jgi:hypothetical protein